MKQSTYLPPKQYEKTNHGGGYLLYKDSKKMHFCYLRRKFESPSPYLPPHLSIQQKYCPSVLNINIGRRPLRSLCPLQLQTISPFRPGKPLQEDYLGLPYIYKGNKGMFKIFSGHQ